MVIVLSNRRMGCTALATSAYHICYHTGQANVQCWDLCDVAAKGASYPSGDRMALAVVVAVVVVVVVIVVVASVVVQARIRSRYARQHYVHRSLTQLAGHCRRALEEQAP